MSLEQIFQQRIVLVLNNIILFVILHKFNKCFSLIFIYILLIFFSKLL